MFQVFYWNGKQIINLKRFCQEHSCQMCRIKHIKKEILPNGRIYTSEEIIVMPEVFWKSFGYSNKDGTYELIEKYDL
jgi:hypothetical protein